MIFFSWIWNPDPLGAPILEAQRGNCVGIRVGGGVGDSAEFNYVVTKIIFVVWNIYLGKAKKIMSTRGKKAAGVWGVSNNFPFLYATMLFLW